MSDICAGGCVQTYTATDTATPCNCTGQCRTLGYCPCNPPQPYACGHYFPWHGVVPPSYCPICGSWIGPVYTGPRPAITYHFHTTTGDRT